MKKVLLVIDQIAQGGAERILVDYYHWLEENGTKVKVFVLSGNASQSVWTEGLDVSYGVEKDVDALFGKLKNLILCIRKLRELYDEFTPNAVFSFLEKSNVLSSFLPNTSRKVLSVHNVLSVQYLKISNFFLRFLWSRFLKWRYNSSKSILLAVSEQVKEDLVKSFGVKGKKILVVNNFVNRQNLFLKSQEVIDDFCFEEDGFYFMNIGRFSLQKAQWKLIKAFYLLLQDTSKNVHLILMGNGENESKIKDLVSNLSISDKVHVLPFKKNPYKYLKHASMFVLSSLYEGFPIVVAEAAALEIPFMGSDKAMPKEMFDSQEYRNQCVFPVSSTNQDFSLNMDDDVYALYELMKKGLNDETYRTSLFSQIENWNRKNDIRYQFDAYSNLLGLYE